MSPLVSECRCGQCYEARVTVEVAEVAARIASACVADDCFRVCRQFARVFTNGHCK